MKDYHINIFYCDEVEGYIADIPDLEFCSAYGKSPEEALSSCNLSSIVASIPCGRGFTGFVNFLFLCATKILQIHSSARLLCRLFL